MQFLKTLFWIVLTAALVLLSYANWKIVTLTLWGGLELDIRLPLLLLIFFLFGFLPTLILHRTRVWRMNRRLDSLERQGQSTTAPPVAAPVAAADADEAARLP
jgi:pilus assembly protein TadC